MDVRELILERVYWIHLAEDIAGCCEHGNEASDYIKGREFLN
jgi:hypothetical protein